MSDPDLQHVVTAVNVTKSLRISNIRTTKLILQKPK